MKLFNNTKAVSPLIATVLLLVVVVGVGAVVTGMVRGYITDSKQKTEASAAATSCSTSVDFDAVIINEDKQVCKGDGYVEFMLENKAGDIDDFQINVYSSSSVVQNTSVLQTTETFGYGATKLYNATFSGMAQADIVEIDIIPKLKSPQGKYLVCSDVAIKVKNPSDC